MGRQFIERASKVVPVTIANGASLSGEVDLEGYALAAIVMPSAWTAAALTFQAARGSGGTYQDVYDDAGAEVTVASANVVASRTIVNKAILEQLASLRFLKLRSGTTALPVNQAAERTLFLILKA